MQKLLALSFLLSVRTVIGSIWRLLGVVCVAGWGISAYGQLEWQKREVELYPEPSETKTVTEFLFENKGNKPVTIVSVKSSCGCTTAQPDKKIYQPGEKGIITVRFSFGKRRGLQTKQVIVITNAAERLETVLQLKVWIPDVLKISPTFVSWGADEEKEPRKVFIQALKKGGITIKNLRSSNPQIKVELKILEEGQKYCVVITPPQARLPIKSIVQFEALPASQGQKALSDTRRYYIHAFIKAAAHTSALHPPVNL